MTVVGVVGSTRPDYFADNIVDTLRRMGHRVVALGAGRPWRYHPNQWWRRADRLLPDHSFATALHQRHVVERAEIAGVEMTISVDATVSAATIQRLGALGPTAFWFPDHVANIGSQTMLTSGYDAMFFKDPVLVERLRRDVQTVHYLPEACNSSWHTSGPRTVVDPVVVVAGNMYPSRMILLERLHGAGVPLALYGAGWARNLERFRVRRLPLHPPVFRWEKARVFRQAAAVLNNLHPAEEGMNCRLFEATGAGAVVLAERRPVLDDLFHPGEEVLDFSSFDELMDRVRWAMDDPQKATAIGDAASVRAHGEHTYENRLSVIGQQLSVSL